MKARAGDAASKSASASARRGQPVRDFREPDISVNKTDDGLLRVRTNGVDVFHHSTGEVHGDGPEAYDSYDEAVQRLRETDSLRTNDE